MSTPAEHPAPHEVYVSLAQVEYNPKSDALEVALKLHTHDLDRALGSYFRENINLGEPGEHPEVDSLLADYLQKKLIISCDEEPLELRFYGKEVSVENTWCYFEFPLNCQEGSIAEVENLIFTEIYPKQVNIMKFTAAGVEDQSLQLDRDNTRGTFQLP